MVRFTLKRSLRAASCCNVDVMNGGTGLRRFSYWRPSGRRKSTPSTRRDDRLRRGFIRDLDVLVVLLGQVRRELRRLLGGQVDVDGPVFAA